MKSNQISAELTTANVELALTKIDEIATLLPFLISLTMDERHGGLKPGDVNVAWLAKIKEYINQAPQFVPQYFDAVEGMKDLNITTSLSAIIKKANVLVDKLEDTFMQAGYESLLFALAYYEAVKRAADNNVPGAQTIYDDLKKRFPGRNKNTPPSK